MCVCESLSVVVIGQNESQTLPQVLERCIELTTEFNVHIIYVDSNSDDNSLQLVENFARSHEWLKITIIHLSGQLNAAIARNAGLKSIENNTQWIFFLDADIVFEPLFVVKAVNALKEDGNSGSITGKLRETFINAPPGNNHERVLSSKHENGKILNHGGNFITSMNIIKNVGRFDERLAQHEDADLCFRIRKKGNTLLLLGDCLGTHYTVSYNAPDRIWRDLKRARGIASGLFIKKYLFSRYLLETLRITKYYIIKMGILILLTGGLMTANYLLFFSGLLPFVLILHRRNQGAGETVLSKTLSFVCGVNLLLGFFYFPGKYRYNIKLYYQKT